MQDEIFETNKEEEEDTNLLSEKKFVKFSFLLFGIGGLLSCNIFSIFKFFSKYNISIYSSFQTKIYII